MAGEGGQGRRVRENGAGCPACGFGFGVQVLASSIYVSIHFVLQDAPGMGLRVIRAFVCDVLDVELSGEARVLRTT